MIETIKKEWDLMVRVWRRARKPDPAEVDRLTRVTLVLIAAVGTLGILTSFVNGFVNYLAEVFRK